MSTKGSRTQPAAPKLNRATINRHKVQWALNFRQQLQNFMMLSPEPEALQAVKELDQQVCGAIIVE